MSVWGSMRHRFVLHSGEVLEVPGPLARRVIDKRSDRAPAETVWEITLPSGLIRRLWPDEIRDWDIEDV